MIHKTFIIVCILIQTISGFSQGLFLTKKGSVNFSSDAPLELIEAESFKVEGLIKISDRSFAFRVSMKSFEGFNSSLQKTHFNENYLESARFPFTTFEGKIIEEIDFLSPGTHNVRGKGRFVCHGVEQERIIKCKITISANKIVIKSEFTILLDDHNIKIPSVVSQKIAEEIIVNISTELELQK